METKRDIFDRIQNDLEGPVFYLCRDVVSFLISDNAKKLNHITYHTLLNGVEILDLKPTDRALLLKVTDYLSSNKLHLLDMHFQFIESDDSEPVPLDDEEISSALFEGVFYHPETGRPVENYRDLIFPYFTPTKLLESIHV